MNHFLPPMTQNVKQRSFSRTHFDTDHFDTDNVRKFYRKNESDWSVRKAFLGSTLCLIEHPIIFADNICL